jgi:hypothetical protein
MPAHHGAKWRQAGLGLQDIGACLHCARRELLRLRSEVHPAQQYTHETAMQLTGRGAFRLNERVIFISARDF